MFFRRRRCLKQIVLFLVICVFIVFIVLIKLNAQVDLHNFSETEAIRILGVKAGICNKPTKSVLLPADAGSYHGYPKLVHRIFLVWHGRSPKMPQAWQENVNICRRKTPDFHHVIWEDYMVLEFFTEHYPWFLGTYRAYTYDVMRVDAAKYFILYHYGGIYLDLDERCVSDLKQLVDIAPEGYGMSIPQGNPMGLSNAVFMAKGCHNFLGYVISRMKHDNMWYLVPYATIMFSTGPRFLSFKYLEYVAHVQTAEDEPIFVFPTEYVIKHKYIEKIKGQTWFSWDGAIIFAFYRLWRKVTFQIPV